MVERYFFCQGANKMKIVLMQPYFFPYIGYFTLIKHADVFVVFDIAQYIRRGWVHRNRILGFNGEPVYVNAQVVKAPQNTSINQIKLHNTDAWKQKILKKMEVYKNIAPNYQEVYQLVEECLNGPSSSLAELNVQSLIAVSDFLDLPHNIVQLSEMKIELTDIFEPDDWGLRVSQYYGAHTYINAPGGQEFYNREKYAHNGIEMLFYRTKLAPYNQKMPVFHAGLSIIDVLMFNTKEEIHQMMNDFEIL